MSAWLYWSNMPVWAMSCSVPSRVHTVEQVPLEELSVCGEAACQPLQCCWQASWSGVEAQLKPAGM